MTAPVPAALGNPAKQHFIGGAWHPSVSGETLDTWNPATGTVLATLARGGPEDIDRAVASARRAFEGPWSRFTPNQRMMLLMRAAEVLESNYDELAMLESMDMGAPHARVLGMKGSLVQLVQYFGSQAVNWTGTTIPNSLKGSFTTLTLKAPVGVVGGIIPWNAPLLSMWWIMGGALATGCTAVIKPAEDASLTTLRTAELLMEAGVPEGVINVVTGYGTEAGAALAAHMDVDRIAFTGSTQTGREIIRASAGNMKRIQVELGGKSPDIVFADADLDRAVPGAAMGVFTNSGQICSAGTRVFVQRGIQEAFLEAMAAYTKTIRVGDPFDSETQLGPLVSERQLERVMGYVESGHQEGARLSAGGHRVGGALAQGYFMEPTIFGGVTNDMTIAREEIFGPVASVIPFDTEEEALRLANDTSYGLAGAVWTSSLGTATRMIHGMKAGKLWVNAYGLADPAVGFSGYKQSGYGMKGGRDHIEAFLYEKSVYINNL
ncbi:aldehyde dehydrogenase family protein [Salipiger sp. P9]|uniref:aldehyde dehydrogenase family protein n=1 Tax=Salipiger pentaromativorans TaxID=2943193 RepID=UPI0021577DF9|nr:aldehyde dehydrogenase family protein [Salipiger pentaromativorans]MCR8548153.1 aldehyde dehydrogenase family protein [Salipiger pentaromativorans]